jgi:predicted TIM-barrel fold metal-dependent hydrolase
VAQRVEEREATEIDIQRSSLTRPQVDVLQGQSCIEPARQCNGDLAGIARQDPNRFRALASGPLTATVDAASQEPERCLDELGMVSVLVDASSFGRYRSYPDCPGTSLAPGGSLWRLYLETVSPQEPALRCVLETVRTDRLVGGSDDWDVIGAVGRVNRSVEAARSAGSRRRIPGETAARLFSVAA